MPTERDTHTTDHLETVSVSGQPVTGSAVPYLVVLAGESVGRVIRLKPGEKMQAGRIRKCEIFLDCENISRRHAAFALDQDGNTTVTDLGSTNGTLVNGKKIASHILEDGDRICLGNVILRYSIKDDLEYDFQQQLYHKATRDPLTGSFNKRYFLEMLDKEFAFHARQNLPLSLIILDLDDFKKLNDTYGHVNGDIVLKNLAKELMNCIRQEDLFARFGGEEFVVLFRMTTTERARSIANKLLTLVRNMHFTATRVEFGISATVGLATYADANLDSGEELLMAADRNLYIGKNQGKNRVIG